MGGDVADGNRSVPVQYPAYKHGAWVFQPRKNKHICCASKRHTNDARCVKTGPLKAGQLVNVHGGVCACKGRPTTIGPGEWIWKPSARRQLRPEWDRDKFCSFLGDRMIYIIGDSTFQQTAGVLMNMLAESNGTATCYNQVKFLMSYLFAPDHLPGLSKEKSTVERGRSLEQWIDTIGENQSAVLVIGVGAHLNQMRDYSIVMDWLVQYFTQHRSLFADSGRLRLILKTNNAHRTSDARPAASP